MLSFGICNKQVLILLQMKYASCLFGPSQNYSFLFSKCFFETGRIFINWRFDEGIVTIPVLTFQDRDDFCSTNYF